MVGLDSGVIFSDTVKLRDLTIHKPPMRCTILGYVSCIRGVITNLVFKKESVDTVDICLRPTALLDLTGAIKHPASIFNGAAGDYS